jgi:hypothetical protein
MGSTSTPSISTVVRVWLSMLNQKEKKVEWLMRRRRVVVAPGLTCTTDKAPPVHEAASEADAGHVVELTAQSYVCWPLRRKLSGMGSTPGTDGDQGEEDSR